MIPFLFLPSNIMSKPVIDTLNLLGFTLDVPLWYLDPPTPPLNPQIMLKQVQTIKKVSDPPPVTQSTTPTATFSPLTLMNIWGKEPKNPA